jgi:hypothetical protein
MGKPRKYDDLAGLAAKRTAATWLAGLAEGESRRGSLYRFARYVRWCRKGGKPADPDQWVSECQNGTNRTLIEHAQTLRRYCEDSGEFKDLRKSTAIKSYSTVRRFYASHLIPFPSLRPKIPNGHHFVEVRAHPHEGSVQGPDVAEGLPKIFDFEKRSHLDPQKEDGGSLFTVECQPSLPCPNCSRRFLQVPN